MPGTATPPIQRATIIGGGVIGGSWTALFLAHGLEVTLNDADPAALAKVRATIQSAQPVLAAQGLPTSDLEAQLHFETDLTKALAHAELVQECGPERLLFKQELWQTIEAAAPADALLLSSSSGIPASVQNAQMREPGRLMIAHPFNPPHLLPLVEMVPSAAGEEPLIERAMAFYRSIGKLPLRLNKEIPGFVANRLQAALFQESLQLVKEGIVTLDTLDQIITHSLGIRWATAGPFLSFHLGGGSGGLAHMLAHLGPSLNSWLRQGSLPLDEEVRRRLLEQLQASYGHHAYDALCLERDSKQLAILKALGNAERKEERNLTEPLP